MNTVASSSGPSLRTALTMLAAFIAGVLAASSTATLTLQATSIVAGASVLAFLCTCVVWSQRQARHRHLAQPDPLDNLGLVAAIHQLADDISEHYGMHIACRLDIDSAALPRGVEMVTYRLVRDATTTAARHAQALRITLSLRVNDGHCTLHIVDDGPSNGRPGDRFTLSITLNPNTLQSDITEP